MADLNGRDKPRDDKGRPIHAVNDEGQPICGAKTSRGTQCCSRNRKANGRCRNHGGDTPTGIESPHFKDGRHSKYGGVFTGDALEHYGRAIEDPGIIELTEELGVLEVLIMEELKLARVGEGGALWKEIKETWDTFQRAQPSKDTTTAGRCLRRMGDIIEEGVGRHASQEVALDIIERKRKVSETERRRRTDEQTSITESRAVAFVGAIIAVVKEAISEVVAEAISGQIEVDQIERKFNARVHAGVARLVYQNVSAGDGGVPTSV